MREPKVIKRIFDGEPLVIITIDKEKLEREDRYKYEKVVEPSKRIKIEQIEPLVVSQSGSSKTRIQNIIKSSSKQVVSSPKPQNLMPKIALKEPESVQAQKSKINEFSVSNLINEVKKFNKTQEIPETKTEIVAEKSKNYSSDSTVMTTPTHTDEETKETIKAKPDVYQIPEAVKRPPEDSAEDIPPKRSKYEDYYQEGRFSSDEEPLGEPQPADPNLSRVLYDEDIYGPPIQQEEYNVFEFATKQDYSKRKSKKKRGLFNPFSSTNPKPKAPIGSLLQV